MRTHAWEGKPTRRKVIALSVAAYARRAAFATAAIETIASELMLAEGCTEQDVAEAMVQWLLANRCFHHHFTLLQAITLEAPKHG